MEMDCIPAGMQLFPAADEDQFEFIRSVIDDCDYYLLIIAGKYGSLAHDGNSYTEKEYKYAIEKGINVIALIHKDISALPSVNVEISPSIIKKLNAFRNHVSTGSIVRFWAKPEELPGLVALSLNHAMKRYPAVGWVRADTIAN